MSTVSRRPPLLAETKRFTFFAELRSFALKGNVVDLAVAVVIGAAFGKIVTALVSDIVMPIVALVLPTGDWRQAGVVLRHAADPKDDVVLRYGDLLGVTLDFAVVALILFIVVKKLIERREAPAKTKTCPFCCETIPVGASRCKACTSELVST